MQSSEWFISYSIENTMRFRTFFTEQAGHPSGLFGRIVMSKIFDFGNAALNNFLMETLVPEENDHVLEIGFGTGKLISKMSGRINHGLVEGIDLSASMLHIAEKRNRKYINQGRVILRQGDFGEIDYDHNRFDKICSVNTVYFWIEPDKIIQKIHRLLKNGGKLVLAFEDKKQLETRPLDLDIFKMYSEYQIRDILRRNRFSAEIRIESKLIKSDKYHCCIAVK